MEVVAATPGNGTVPPFHNHDVHEWSRIDSLTGCLERARLETDHWTASTQNSSHNYRKVVDSRARSRPDGHVQQEAKRQLEVFNSHVPGGRLQVIKSHTVSSSRWTSTSPSTNPIEFDNLQLSINPIDLSTEKSKAHLSRSTRRPPSRSLLQTTAATNLYRVSQICNEFHNAAIENVNFGAKTTKAPVEERENGDGIEIIELENDSSSSLTKSSSSNENLINLLSDQKLPIKSSEDLEDLEQLQNWRRTSKIRRSLQFPVKNVKSYQKVDDLPQNTGSVRRIKEDLEKGRRLNAALRGNSFDFDALDQILQTINIDENENKEALKQKDNFVTVDSIKEMKGKLKKTPSFKNKLDEDDGIGTECSPKNNVRSYIYGMEKNGQTGSLESKKHFLNKNEDWHNRRKSYGFEKVQQDETISNKSKSKVESSTDSGICRSSEIFPFTKKSSSKVNVNDFNNKKEGTTITIPIISKNYSPLVERKKIFERELNDGISYSIESWKKNDDIKRHSIAVDEMKYVNENQSKFRRTSLAINTDDDDNLIRGRKKVEFCKTEVHFAADSGKVNIVETDEKPPPTNNFRRRRRYSGLIPNEEFNANGLPVFQFGDDQQINEDESFQQTFGIVTVNNNINPNEFIDEKDKNIDNIETEAPKSILKNKPIKPKPYILGLENSLNHYKIDSLKNDSNKNDYFKNDNSPWGVKLKPVDLNPPIWRSTVTVRNTFYDQQNQNHENNKLQDNKYNSDNLLNSIRIQSTPNSIDSPSFCSVQDRIKQVEDLKIENKGYSTKINFGNGGSATIVERNGENHRNLLNDRVGMTNLRNERGTFSRNEDGLKDNTTTTKITIDLNNRTAAASQPLKSTSLILNTLKTETTHNLHNHHHPHRNHNNENESKLAVQQLEELKKLYEDVYSDDSETDKEVQSFMTKNLDNGIEDAGSVISGSWTRATAYKNISQYAQTCNVDDGKKRLHAQLEKDVNGLNNIIKVTPSIQRSNNESKHYQDMSKKPLKPSSPRTTLYQTQQKNGINLKTPNSENLVLRQPKKSEMAYFGVPISPQVTRRAERKDLRADKNKAVQKLDSNERNQNPIYENVERMNNNSKKMTQTKLKREFDASILDELTKAADQILQAVNGYTDEDHKYTTTDDEKSKRRVEPLETISETKSWKQQNESKMKQKNVFSKQQKLSSSSVDSVNKDKHSIKSTSSVERKKKSMESNSKAITKARRLQRASSREALLQSHGSSSEDLAIEVPPLRKPRLIRKKITTASMSLSGSSMEVKKKEKNKDNERLPLALPEIRHKTAVSTIRSTAEKAKDNKLKAEHKKRPIKKDIKMPFGSSKVEKSAKDGATSTHHQQQVHKEKISTANIKKCTRYDSTTKR
ncbi:interaptin isoform X1 [Onthophagus taurus]|uniref:interaptin isoform X1 n=1 Tax=Onthophagus taurus TaxID=166361 RepID=UPI0039BE69EC